MTITPHPLDDSNFPEVTSRVGASGTPRPVLRTTGVSVRTLRVASNIWNESLEEIAAEYGLRLDQVEQALAFGEAHTAEIEGSLALDEALAEEAAGARAQAR